jgi:hypothetical protein
MSTTLHLNDDDLVLHYYGEMTAGEETHAGALSTNAITRCSRV